MRIISGSRKGKKLSSVPGWNTRPTSDRIKESVFNILPPIGADMVVLDLYAGTGALAIEALSRGAAQAMLLDRDPKAIAIIKKNLLACGFFERAEIKAWDIAANLNCLVPIKSRFNLIFMDPPYNQSLLSPTLLNLINSNVLAADAIVVIEHSTSEPLVNLPDKLSITSERKYGKTLVSFLNYML